jgi:hypothetical protein
MPLDTLKAGILYAMKENLNVQFVYPSYPLPVGYEEVIESIDHVKIKPLVVSDGADVAALKELLNLVSFFYGHLTYYFSYCHIQLYL